MVNVGSKLVLDVLARAFFNYKMGDVTDILIGLYLSSDEATLKFIDECLDDEGEKIFNILLKCSDKISRINTAKLVSAVLNRAVEIEKDILYEIEEIEIKPEEAEETEDPKEEKPKTIKRHKAKSVRFINLYLMVMKEYAPGNWARFAQFLSVIKNLVCAGPVHLDLMMSMNCLVSLIDFMLGQRSPLITPGETRTKMGGYTTPDFKNLLEAVSWMI